MTQVHEPAPTTASCTWADRIRAWPDAVPLACATVGQDGRWVVLGPPSRVVEQPWADPMDPLGALDRSLGPRGEEPSSHRPAPPGPGWIALLPYELGAAAEPRGFGRVHHAARPAWTLVRLDNGLAIDRHTGGAHRFGGWIEPAGPPHVSSFAVGPLRPDAPAEAYQRAVAQARAYTHAGDIFQANLAHQLIAPWQGSARALAARLFESLDPTFPCYIELPGLHTTIVSVSPELFLHRTPMADGGARLVTRPIKGTRPCAHMDVLRRSAKDAAELAMIVDLMRNDLGRVARGGTVRVDDARTIEVHHAGHIAHTVATVSAELRAGTTLGDVLRATMPPGSVTGAPKVRALQVIEELERPMFGGPRGAYCGGLGYLEDTGGMTLSVGIRTLTLCGDRLSLPVGAGIVADSRPVAEWEETLAKAAPIVQALGSTLSL